MKVLLINKFYYRRGGDCTYALNLEKLLIEKGHDVAFFSCDYPDNIYSSYSSYFPEKVFFNGSFPQKVKAAFRTIWGIGVKSKFKKLIKDFNPDVVHINNIHSYLSPIVKVIADLNKIPVIWTLHDYKLICPAYICLRNNAICESCFKDKSAVLKHRCMKNSYSSSLVAMLEAYRWNTPKKMSNVVFVCPSVFMKSKMIEGGFVDNKYIVLNNFMYDVIPSKSYQRDTSYCYVGRLSKEKGVETLLRAAQCFSEKLYIVGEGPLLKELKDKYESDNIVFMGRLDYDGVSQILSKCKFSVVPSEWYENNPLSIIESLCLGTPVLGAKIGGIPELIDVGVNGLLFDNSNLHDLIAKIKMMHLSDFDYHKIKDNALYRFNQLDYYNNIISVYHRVINTK